MTEQITRTHDLVLIYKGSDGLHYWHRVAANGEVLSDGGEGFTSLFDCFDRASDLNPGCVIEMAQSTT